VPRAVTESGNSARPCRREVHVLDLDVAQPLPGALEQQVDAAVAPVHDLAPEPGIVGERLHAPGGHGLGDELVGMAGIDADERGAAAEVCLHQLPGVAVLARRAVALRQPHHGAGRSKAHHRAGVGAGGGDDAAVVEAHVGEEALVALNERAAQQRTGQAHGAAP